MSTEPVSLVLKFPPTVPAKHILTSAHRGGHQEEKNCLKNIAFEQGVGSEYHSNFNFKLPLTQSILACYECQLVFPRWVVDLQCVDSWSESCGQLCINVSGFKEY